MKSTEPRLELLEQRIAPAGVVDVTYNPASGDLTLTGDVNSNDVLIYKTGAKNIRIAGSEGGTDLRLNGGTDLLPFIDIGKLSKLTINGDGGDDYFSITGVTATALSVDLGAGSDELEVYDLTVKGDSDISVGTEGGSMNVDGTFSKFAKNLNFTGDTDSAELNLEAGVITIGGALRVTGTSSGDTVTTGYLTAISIAKGIDFTGNGGNDRIEFSGRGNVTIGKGALGASVAYTGGSDNDQLQLGGGIVKLLGFISADLGDGSNSLVLGGEQSVVTVGTDTNRRSVIYTGGFGYDEFTSEPYALNLAGGVQYNPGDGGDSYVGLDGDGILKIGKDKLNGLSFEVMEGSEADEYYFGGQSVIFAGGIAVTAGSDDLDFDIDGVLVSIGKSNIGESINVTGSDFGDFVDFDATRMLIAGDAFFDLGDGEDTVDITGAHFAAKSAGFLLGGDDDEFTFDVFTFALGGNLKVDGEGGDDFISFIGDGLIKGDVELDVSTGVTEQEIFFGSQSGIVGNLRVGGIVDIFSFADAGVVDRITIEEVSAAKAFLIDLGEGDSQVNIENLFTKGTLDILTQGGNDTVNFERRGYFGPSIASKAVEIDLGDGNDVLNIGDATVAAIKSHFSVRFLAAVTIDGGAGSNTANADLETANTFPSAPTLTNI
jgi:hypothetical protein